MMLANSHYVQSGFIGAAAQSYQFLRALSRRPVAACYVGWGYFPKRTDAKFHNFLKSGRYMNCLRNAPAHQIVSHMLGPVSVGRQENPVRWILYNSGQSYASGKNGCPAICSDFCQSTRAFSGELKADFTASGCFFTK